MPAAVRGGSRGTAKPRAKAPASPQAKRPVAKAEGGGARSLSPKHILMIAGGVLTLALGVTLATGGRGQQIANAVGMGVDGKFGEAGFRLRTVHVQGASALATADIVRAANVHKDDPLLGMDLTALRERVEKVGWVKEARIVRLLPDTLMISVKERRQLAVWQHGGRSVVIDDHGDVIREADPARFNTLPLVVGLGGAQHAGEILPILVQRPKLMARMEALVRVDDRRWDLRMKDGALIQLPAVDEEQALMQLEQLDLRSRILELGFERIDLRNPDTIAVRPRAPQPIPALTATAAVSTPAEGV
ncbi:MAG: FtsQ-type POTRA domain-containing protein [Alphaproteobacteria bacterium]|nr:FtsQ-type POTRA domain-containing protein [Alphaproteobacteria bacterium]MBU1513040.1 FtsQ-type POTRA domain-containing protein [Alphaproteobacteria bacterium]MBU2095148.1 FtsQ-type POTRA domain-containing protein [Alphaproteobacteria bacterium]MBU2152111.1 FtsQ-type POTRA domain-containing protein [Alphaproteobacteria bacterium]MBU2306399.1 FtsQ-type POTRA domain-containing protein [Alphaproteobacteria bacterium]